jgi:hypothetical protein
MSASREKDQKDYDLEDIVKVIDTALTSDNMAVQNALRSLLLVATIVSAEHPDQVVRHGPLARVFEDYNNLARRLNNLEDEVHQLRKISLTKNDAPFTPPYNPGNPFGPNPTTGWPGTNDPSKPTPMWDTNWSAGDDPNYKGAQSILADMKADPATVNRIVKDDQ